MSEITKLEPKLVWELFDAITRVPRPSKKEEKIREFLVDFAKKHNIDYQTDETSNVVMRVPGTKGYENRPCVILQSHMDMVCEKNSDTAFDFDKDPIRTKIVDGWVKAEGTTLGADDGIGMAAALAALLDHVVVRQRYADTLLDRWPGFPWLVRAAWAGLAATGALIFRGHDFLQGN